MLSLHWAFLKTEISEGNGIGVPCIKPFLYYQPLLPSRALPGLEQGPLPRL